MRKFILALALALAGSSLVYADSIPTVVNAKDGSGSNVWTISVYNDGTTTINSGEIAIWDNADTDVVGSLRPYVIKATGTTSNPLTAGVALKTCAAGTDCELAILGVTQVRCTGTITTGQLVGTHSNPGMCGDHVAGADNRAIGIALESVAAGANATYVPVFLYPADGQ